MIPSLRFIPLLFVAVLPWAIFSLRIEISPLSSIVLDLDELIAAREDHLGWRCRFSNFVGLALFSFSSADFGLILMDPFSDTIAEFPIAIDSCSLLREEMSQEMLMKTHSNRRRLLIVGHDDWTMIEENALAPLASSVDADREGGKDSICLHLENPTPDVIFFEIDLLVPPEQQQQQQQQQKPRRTILAISANTFSNTLIRGTALGSLIFVFFWLFLTCLVAIVAVVWCLCDKNGKIGRAVREVIVHGEVPHAEPMESEGDEPLPGDCLRCSDQSVAPGTEPPREGSDLIFTELHFGEFDELETITTCGCAECISCLNVFAVITVILTFGVGVALVIVSYAYPTDILVLPNMAGNLTMWSVAWCAVIAYYGCACRNPDQYVSLQEDVTAENVKQYCDSISQAKLKLYVQMICYHTTRSGKSHHTVRTFTGHERLRFGTCKDLTKKLKLDSPEDSNSRSQLVLIKGNLVLRLKDGETIRYLQDQIDDFVDENKDRDKSHRLVLWAHLPGFIHSVAFSRAGSVPCCFSPTAFILSVALCYNGCYRCCFNANFSQVEYQLRKKITSPTVISDRKRGRKKKKKRRKHHGHHSGRRREEDYGNDVPLAQRRMMGRAEQHAFGVARLSDVGVQETGVGKMASAPPMDLAY